MSSRQLDDIEVLVRYFAGECAPAEAQALEVRLDASPELRETARVLQSVIAERRDALRDGSVDTMAALANIRTRVTARSSVTLHRAVSDDSAAPRWGERRGLLRVLGVAAAVVLIVGGGWVLDRAADLARARAIAAGAHETDYVTRRGELRRFTLVDGTRVVLAADSRLHVGGFSDAGRFVEVRGAAYFDVTHDPSRPFRVRAGAAQATVLGTEFGVSAYPDDPVTSVVVHRGKVAVVALAAGAPPAAPAILTRDMLARVAGTQVNVGRVDAAKHLAWTHGELVFVNEPVGEVAAWLERWYDVRVDIPAALRDRRVELSFAKTSFEDALEDLAVALHARVIHSGDRYRLEPVAR